MAVPTIERFICGNGSEVITSPGYPSKYGSNMKNIWTFTTHTGRLLSIEFYYFYLQYGSSHDYVSISSDGEVLATHGGSSLPPITVSTDNTLTVVFRTDAYNVYNGFHAKISDYPEARGRLKTNVLK